MFRSEPTRGDRADAAERPISLFEELNTSWPPASRPKPTHVAGVVFRPP